MLTMMPLEDSAVTAEWAARQAHARRPWVERFEPNPDHTAVDGPPELVSVIMPTRNRGRLTRSAIESVMAQTWPHWHLIVVDDGSEDDTALIAEVLAGRDQRITVIRAEHRGASAARNAGLASARGSYVAFLDSDEGWERDVLRAMVAQLTATGADAAYANVRGVIGSGDRFRQPHIQLPELLVRPLIDLFTVVARRRFVEVVGDFDEALPRGGEYDYLIRMAARTELRYAPVIAAEVRVHPPFYDRVMSAESDDWIELVQTRHEVDWVAQERQFRVPNIRSFVVPITTDAEVALAALEAAKGEDHGRWEAVFVDHSDGDQAASCLAPIVEADPALTYLRMPLPVSFEHAATFGFARTHGTSVTLVHATGADRMVRAADVIAAQRVRPEGAR